MIPRRNPYANISLAPPEPIQANFSPPQVNFPAVQMPQEEEGGGLEGILGLAKKRFGGAQGEQIKGALGGQVNPAAGNMA